MYPILFFFVYFFFFFFFYGYFPWQTLAIHRIAQKGEGIIISLVFHFHLLTNIHLVHQDFYNFLNRSICNYHFDSWWDLFSLEIFILTAFSLMQLRRSCGLWHLIVIDIDLLLQRKCLNQLRFTPVATTVYLSHLPNPTPSHHSTSVRLPKCTRNEWYFIFFTRDWEKNNKKHFYSIEIGNGIRIYINIKWVFQMVIDYTSCCWNPKILEYNWTRLLNKCMHAVTRYLLLLQYLKNYAFF